MFYTAVDSEIHIPAQIADPALRCWSMVRLAFRFPSFLVSSLVQNKVDGLKMGVTILCSNIGEIVAFSEENEVTQIARLAPGGANGIDDWQMETITEVWCASEPGLGPEETAVLYVTESETRHIESRLDTEESKLVGLRRIF